MINIRALAGGTRLCDVLFAPRHNERNVNYMSRKHKIVLLFCILIIIAMISALIFFVFRSNPEGIRHEGINGSEDVIRHEGINERAERISPQRAYSDLMLAFMNIPGDLVYPEHYAGAFLSGDTLVIQVTDLSPYVTAFYTDLLGPGAPISFAEVAYSLNQLRAYGEKVMDLLDEQITSFGNDIMANVFEIGLLYDSADSTQIDRILYLMNRFKPLPVTFTLEQGIEVYNGW